MCPKIYIFPQWHQTEDPRTDAPHAVLAVSLEEVQLFEALERPEWEIDLDSVWIDYLPVEIEDRDSPMVSWLISELQPARVK